MSKYRDWRNWFDGLRSSMMKAGAESLMTNITAMLGTNGIASMVPQLHDFAMNWRTALFTTAIQFGMRTALAASTYVANRPDPDLKGFDTVEIKQNEKTTP